MEGMETTSDSVTSLLMSSERLAKEFKPVAFNVEPHQFKLIATESDCEISDDIRLTTMASKVNDRIGKVYW